METTRVFKTTTMYKIIQDLNKILNLNYDLTNFKLSAPFWKNNEKSYLCFLHVLEDGYHDILNKKITRSKTFYIKNVIGVIEEIINTMLIKHIPDDKVEATIDKRCVICLFNEAKITLKCGHNVICPKCFNILILKNIKICPLCRQ